LDRLTLEVVRSGGKKARYDLKYRKGMTVLDALIEVREKQDSTLGFRHSCRMGVCGSCGMNIEGVPRLACQTQVSSLKNEVVGVEPMHGMRVVKDLVVDITLFIGMHKSVKPYLIRKDVKERDSADREYRVLPDQIRNFLQFDLCIMCGLCYSACPTVALDPKYLGPQAIAQAYRYMSDPRDEGWDQRIGILDSSHGLWRCHVAGSCSFVCPKDVDPAKAIQMARVEVMRKRFLGKKARAGSPLVQVTPPAAPKQGQKPPPFDYTAGGES
jgi:succinate dehydrogenase / fumarate reductase iron-sulfur subunit